MKKITKKHHAALAMTWSVMACAATSSPNSASAADKVYNIALSNSYIGNQWRVQMVNLTKAYASKILQGQGQADGGQFRYRRAGSDSGDRRYDLAEGRRDPG